MRDTFSGYYRPSSEEFGALWKEALIVPDANVLLTLYRLGDTTRQRLLDILTTLKDRLFLPYQAGLEFQRNRLSVIEEQKAVYDTVIDNIDDFPNSLGRELREHPGLSRKDLEARLEAALNPVKEYVENARGDHPDPLSTDAIGKDSIRDVLDEVFSGKVGPERDLYELIEEGEQRYERKQPPGYEDKDKKEPARYGDLAIWLDTIEAAKRHSKDVIFVTADRKEDWWWVREGKRIGARPELIAEMRKKAGQLVYLYDVKRFMEEGSKALSLPEFSEDERKDVARAQKASAASGYENFGKYFQILSAANLNLDPKAIEWWRNVELPKVTLPTFQVDPFRWQSSAQVDDGTVTLHVTLKPELIAASGWQSGLHYSCVVTGPSGEESQAIAVNPGYFATFTYPDDFRGGVETGEGNYKYEWFVTGGTGPYIPSGSVASGGFAIESSEADAGPPLEQKP